jgi:hypothetical protein
MYDNSTKRQLDHDRSTKDNWIKRQLDQTTTGPNDNWTKRQLDQTTTGPNDNWTKRQLDQKTTGPKPTGSKKLFVPFDFEGSHFTLSLASSTHAQVYAQIL